MTKRSNTVTPTPFIGEIRILAGPMVPKNWLQCAGQILQISSYPLLYSIIGNAYGGDNNNTFALPDLRGRLPLHFGQGVSLSARSLGETGGSEQVSLGIQHIPLHSHEMKILTKDGDSQSPSERLPASYGPGTFYDANVEDVLPIEMSDLMITSSGGGNSHENRMPSLALSFIIAITGIYPSKK